MKETVGVQSLLTFQVTEDDHTNSNSGSFLIGSRTNLKIGMFSSSSSFAVHFLTLSLAQECAAAGTILIQNIIFLWGRQAWFHNKGRTQEATQRQSRSRFHNSRSSSSSSSWPTGFLAASSSRVDKTAAGARWQSPGWGSPVPTSPGKNASKQFIAMSIYFSSREETRVVLWYRSN